MKILILCEKHIRILCVFLIFIFQFQLVNSQTTEKIIVSGLVEDEAGVPVTGATVVATKTMGSVITDIDGKFSLQADGNETIKISFIGYETQEIAINNRPNINILLVENTKALDEVIVVGYSSMKKSEITGAINSVNMDDVGKRKVANVFDALQGQVSGVQITRSNGAPNSDFKILIRGQGTLNNSDPLYILDGVPTMSIKFLNPNDIASMTVLKDASAASIYGSRAANGVVVITTKSGVKGKNVLELEYYEGFSKAANLPKLLNGEQYMNVMETMWSNSLRNDGVRLNPYTQDRINNPYLSNTNWLDEIFEIGHSRNLVINTSGGGENTNYFLSAGYNSQDGIYKYDNDGYQRFSLRSNIDSRSLLNGFVNIGANVQLSYEEYDWARADGGDDGSRGEGVTRLAFYRPPVIPVYKDPSDPTYSASNPFTDLPFYKDNSGSGTGWSNLYNMTYNPLATIYYTDDRNSTYNTFGNVYGEIDFFKNKSLLFKTNLGINLIYSHNKRWSTNYGDDDGTGTPEDRAYGTGRLNKGGGLSENRGQDFHLTWSNTLNYRKDFGKHGLTALAGNEFITNYASNISGSRTRYDFTSSEFHYLGSGTHNTSWVDGGASEYALLSFFGSATYNFDRRYFTTISLRADASSRFAKDNRWGYFPSVSLGWNISEEGFIKGVKQISDMRLRTSYGKLGNQNIGNYGYVTTIKKVQDKYTIARFGNPDIRWETTTQANIGLDLGLFSNKLYLSAEVFDKNTDGILIGVSLPSYVGAVDATYVNAAEVNNRGFEFSIAHRNEIGDFQYHINANASFIKNKVKALHPTVPSIGTENIIAPGHPINYFYGYEMEGIYQTKEEIREQQYASTNILDKPGDIRFRDVNGDGVIDEKDRKIIGKPNPDITYGLNASASYKGFSLSVFFQGVQGLERVSAIQGLNLNSREFNKTTEVLKSWSGPGTSNTMPRLSFDDIGVGRHPFSTAGVKDASYLRLKNVELAYSFGNYVRKLNATDVTLFVSCQNLLTITKWSGMDPELNSLGDPMNYPNARIYQLGLKLKF